MGRKGVIIRIQIRYNPWRSLTEILLVNYHRLLHILLVRNFLTISGACGHRRFLESWPKRIIEIFLNFQQLVCNLSEWILIRKKSNRNGIFRKEKLSERLTFPNAFYSISDKFQSLKFQATFFVIFRMNVDRTVSKLCFLLDVPGGKHAISLKFHWNAFQQSNGSLRHTCDRSWFTNPAGESTASCFCN